MLYRTTKCPYCAHILEYRVTTAEERIGPQTAECPSCGKTHATGMKQWEDMDGYDKTFYVLRSIALFPKTILMYTLGSVLLPGLVMYLLMDEATLDKFLDSHIGIVLGYAVLAAFFWTALYVRAEVLRIRGEWHEQEPPNLHA